MLKLSNITLIITFKEKYMIADFIVRTATRNEEKIDYKNPIQRSKIGSVTGIVGIIFNISITIMKLIIGYFTNSLSIVADGINNLTDAASSLVTAVGMAIAGKASDEDHPYGHGRMEYLATLTISVVILFVGLLLLKSSVEGLFNPKVIEFSWVSVVVLLISIGMKYIMYAFYTNISKRIDSSTLKASAIDSISDVMVTSIVVVAFILSNFSTLPIDSIGGLIVSAFILKSGYDLIMEMINELVGESVDEEVLENILKIFEERKEIVDTHDLNIHSYGPNCTYATIDAVVKNSMTVEEVHEIFTEIEYLVLEKFNIQLTIHMDVLRDETKEEVILSDALKEYKDENDYVLSYHDEEIIDLAGTKTVAVHAVVDGNVIRTNEEEIEEIFKIKEILKERFGNSEYHIIIDKEFENNNFN